VAGHCHLNGQRAFHRIHRTGKFDQGTVAHHLDDAAAVLGNGGVEAGGPDVAQRSERSRFIGSHQPRVAGNVGGEDGYKAALGSVFDHRLGSRPGTGTATSRKAVGAQCTGKSGVC
jgi:hypothetical protein